MKDDNKTLYGSFMLGNSEYAIDAVHLQEVINLPEPLTQIPLTPDCVIGVFNMRGMIVPIVDMHRLIPGSEARDPVETPKVVVVDCQGVRVGLMFDGTGEIFRAGEDEKSHFEYKGSSAQKMVNSVIRFQAGKRIVQVLDPTALVSIQNLQHVLGNQKHNGLAYGERHGKRRKVITFMSAGTLMAFEIAGIYEILRVPELEDTALKSDLCLGRINVRGQVVPVVDFAHVMGRKTRMSVGDEEQRIIVFKNEDLFVGVLVDEVESINFYYQEDLLPIPHLNTIRSGLFVGLCETVQTGQEIILVDHMKLQNDPEVVDLAKGHRHVYPSEMKTTRLLRAHQANETNDRTTFITFRLDQIFGVPISDVKEVIDYNEDVVVAPGMPTFVKGLLNLRGDLVTVIDARVMYNMKASEAVRPRIMIFQSGKDRFGLMVDSIETIASTPSGPGKGLPDAMYAHYTKQFGGDICEVLEVIPPEGEKYTMFVLNTAPLADKIPRTA